ncbi:hypothetical protein M8C13_04360 [Crossiella sp. SN42]|uniref:hypothetical protein n=1 Tax=Crossiella sp. SN42 TaxID=2944808 RepID=UPI00207D4354|nr:hypothetical protein [Crossiella sp. SN42]MCO1574991.1 hypothetical protein [Crossiella sp. SN42]
MSYESRAYDKQTADGFGPDPVVVLVVTGTHDVSRLVHLFSRGLIEHVAVGQRMRRQVRRHNGGRTALELLKAHGGPDFTAELQPSAAAELRAQADKFEKQINTIMLTAPGAASVVTLSSVVHELRDRADELDSA